MREHDLPRGIPIGEQTVAFLDLHKQFAVTPHGQSLRENIRFSPYKPDTVTNGEWQKMFGADVNNLEHMPLSLGMTKSFLSHCANPSAEWGRTLSSDAIFTPFEQQQLLLTATVHDWAEAIVGDIPYPLKTPNDEEQELVILRDLIHEVLGDETNPEGCDQVANNVISVLADTGSKLGRAFNAIERVGYVRTVLRAKQHAEKMNGQVGPIMTRMAGDVVTRHVSQLVSYADVYPPVHSYLAYQQEPISEILSTHDTDELTRSTWFDFFIPGVMLGRD